MRAVQTLPGREPQRGEESEHGDRHRGELRQGRPLPRLPAHLHARDRAQLRVAGEQSGSVHRQGSIR